LVYLLSRSGCNCVPNARKLIDRVIGTSTDDSPAMDLPSPFPRKPARPTF
jgi:hypothetical protein